MAYLLLKAASYDGEIWHADAYRPCAGHVLGIMSIGVVVTKTMTLCVHTVAAVTSDRSVEHRQYRPVAGGWLASARHCNTINSTGLAAA